MNKTISLLLLIASIGVLSALDFEATDLLSISPSFTTVSSTAAAITCTFGKVLAVDDAVVFSKANPPTSGDPEFILTGTIESTYLGTVSPAFSVDGTYNIFLRKGAGGTPVLQTNAHLIVYKAITANEIASISPITVAINTVAESIVFTLGGSNTLIADVDKIIFAIGGTPADTDPLVAVTGTFTTSITATLNKPFAVADSYFVYVKRGDTFLKQTTPILIVKAAPTATEIVSLTKTAITTDQKTATTFSIAFDTTMILNDVVIFSTSSTPSNSDLSVILDSTTSPKAASVIFTTGGAYNVFVKRANTIVKQTGAGIQITVSLAPPIATLLTAVTPTTATTGKAAQLSFTIAAGLALTTEDTIVFSTASTTTDKDSVITVDAATTTSTFTGSMTFATEGKYNVFVDNGIPVQQTGLVIEVTIGSSFISLTLVLGALLFLF